MHLGVSRFSPAFLTAPASRNQRLWVPGNSTACTHLSAGSSFPSYFLCKISPPQSQTWLHKKSDQLCSSFIPCRVDSPKGHWARSPLVIAQHNFQPSVNYQTPPQGVGKVVPTTGIPRSHSTDHHVPQVCQRGSPTTGARIEPQERHRKITCKWEVFPKDRGCVLEHSNGLSESYLNLLLT